MFHPFIIPERFSPLQESKLWVARRVPQADWTLRSDRAVKRERTTPLPPHLDRKTTIPSVPSSV